MQYAEPGSISSGTLRTEDLLTAFSSHLEYLVQTNAEAWCSDEGRAKRDEYMRAIDDANDILGGRGELAAVDDDDASETLVELEDHLDDFAPEGHQFGAHEGDGSDFGFWPVDQD